MEYSERKVVTVMAHLLLQWQLYFPLSVVVVTGFRQHPVQQEVLKQMTNSNSQGNHPTAHFTLLKQYEVEDQSSTVIISCMFVVVSMPQPDCQLWQQILPDRHPRAHIPQVLKVPMDERLLKIRSSRYDQYNVACLNAAVHRQPFQPECVVVPSSISSSTGNRIHICNVNYNKYN